MNSYKTSNVCAKEVSFEIVDNKISSVNFLGGCNGNLKGISSLIEGMEVNDAMNRLRGITCGTKGTSCPDQLSKALEEYLSKTI
ncbi:TSCPD domain-containing protein [Clostridium zeae]|uniref:ribonucleoside-diphosphate reductase n=1 Tax=Clostridium zeae TaxID=2759022 RepID=A0ABQ1E7B6_9CLOT|nr:TIGR03905 family TSCPD domain-containing protein [Clostridium zeae]GFZ30576.1 TSCPD domain-containing protein [Clostridium zeae]